jgi:hypothetical protein
MRGAGRGGIAAGDRPGSRGTTRRRLTVEGVIYEVAAELAGETVVLWWGLFDQDLYVEHGDRRFGPGGSNIRMHIGPDGRGRDVTERRRPLAGPLWRYGVNGDTMPH